MRNMYGDDGGPREIQHPTAPTREEISRMTSLDELYELISDATDRCISIETQLQFLDTGDHLLKGRRVAALIAWRQANKNAKNRINYLNATRNREATA
jgi:hypothetical protein